MGAKLADREILLNIVDDLLQLLEQTPGHAEGKDALQKILSTSQVN